MAFTAFGVAWAALVFHAVRRRAVVGYPVCTGSNGGPVATAGGQGVAVVGGNGRNRTACGQPRRIFQSRGVRYRELSQCGTASRNGARPTAACISAVLFRRIGLRSVVKAASCCGGDLVSCRSGATASGPSGWN